jgi:hypothetical protein
LSFLVRGKIDWSFSRDLRGFFGVFFAGGGWEQWSVASCSMVEAGGFFCPAIFNFSTFFWFCMFRIG